MLSLAGLNAGFARDPRKKPGAPLKAERVAGRDDSLFILRGREIFRITVDEAGEAAGR